MQLILLGIALPIGYVFVNAMFLSEFTVGEITFVAAGSVLCPVSGVIAIMKTFRI